MKKLLVIGSQILILAGCSGNDAADPTRDIAQAPASPVLSTFQVPDEPKIQSEPQGPSVLPEPSALTPTSREIAPPADFSAPQHDSQLVVGGPEPKPATPIETLAPQIRALQSDLTGFLSLDSGGWVMIVRCASSCHLLTHWSSNWSNQDQIVRSSKASS